MKLAMCCAADNACFKQGLPCSKVGCDGCWAWGALAVATTTSRHVVVYIMFSHDQTAGCIYSIVVRMHFQLNHTHCHAYKQQLRSMSCSTQQPQTKFQCQVSVIAGLLCCLLSFLDSIVATFPSSLLCSG